jgi:hypothetical protein
VLIAARAQALLIGLLRLGLAFGGLALALARGVEPRVAVELFALAAGVLAFAVYARGGRGRGGDPAPAVEPVRIETRARALAAATYPSTIGLTVLTAIALGLNAALAALLAGLLCGLGVVALLVAAEIAAWEWRHGGRLLTERGPEGRVFVQRG